MANRFVTHITDNLVLTLLLLVLVLPFLSVIYLLNTELEAKIRLVALQKAGIAQINSLHTLIVKVQQHRGMANALLHGEQDFVARLSKLGMQIDGQIRKLDARHADSGSTFTNRKKWETWRNAWRNLRQYYQQMAPENSFSAHTQLIEELLAAIREVVENHNLELDTRADSRVLTETVIHLPRQIENIAQARGLGSGIVARGEISNEEKIRLLALGQSISVEMETLLQNMGTLFKHDALIKKHMSSVLNQGVDKTSKFLMTTYGNILEPATPTITAVGYFTAGTEALKGFLRIFDTVENELERLLGERLNKIHLQQTMLWVSTILVIAAMFTIYMLFLRQQKARRRLWQELQQSVKELGDSKRKIQAIVENAADGIITIDENGVIDSFSPAAERMFGYTAGEVRGEKIDRLILAQDDENPDAKLYDDRKTGTVSIINPGSREVLARRRDGSVFPIDLAMSEMRLDDHHRLFVGITRDITRRKEAEKALRSSEERLTLMMQGTRDGLWDWDLSSGQIYFSPRWKQMLGYDEKEIENNFLALQELLHPEDLGRALDTWLECLEGKTTNFAIEYRLQTKRGDYLWIYCRGLARHDEAGNPIRMAGSHTDITDSKNHYMELVRMAANLDAKAGELERINRELDQFAYVTSHDLKAPLRAISNLSQWIEEDLAEVLTDDTRKQMALLRGRVLRMESLINGILQYSRAGRVNMEIETVDVTQLINEILEGMDVPPAFHIEIAANMPVVTTARIPLLQIFSNLISNAIKYHHRRDGHISVSVRKIDQRLPGEDCNHRQERETGEGQQDDSGYGYYEFSVADDGPGIAPQYHEKVFQIFQTLQARDEVESTGVGLTLVKKLVEELGGGIRLESAEGEGAVFYFTLPITATEEESATQKMEQVNEA